MRILLHPRSFADRAICPGSPGCPNQIWQIPGHNNVPINAAGPPDYAPSRGRINSGIYTLGCKGSGTWEFTDNLIVDVPGPDIFVFEVGKAVEPMTVEISIDGTDWIKVGSVGGSKASIDIGPHVKPDDVFRFVRLTDLGRSCKNDTPGADIDAVAAIAFSWLHIVDDSSTVFFEYDKWDLLDEARSALDRLFSEYRNWNSYRLRIVGHTDGVGGDQYNQLLSHRRAEAVAQYLILQDYIELGRVTAHGEGRLRPLASNKSRQGRSLNRRVELYFLPTQACQRPTDRSHLPAGIGR